MGDLADVTITAADAEWLAGFVRSLVDDGLVACGNIVPQIRSIYTWQGKTEDDVEALAILHTKVALVQKIIEHVDAEHPDETPQVLEIPISESHPGYREWLMAATRNG